MKYRLITCIFVSVIVFAFLSGCATVILKDDRAAYADEIAENSGLEKVYIEANGFTLLTYQKTSGSSDNIRIYIEGDGRAWERRTRLSDDPTPSNPVGLRLAACDTGENVVYIARPGQFPLKGSASCDPTYWSVRRFSPEVIEAFNTAIDDIKTNTGCSGVELVGYSGGGAIVVLTAAGRKDVISIRTVAGNLDHKALSEYHKVSLLDGSLNPIDYASIIKDIPQRHFTGSRDKVVPGFIARSFVQTQGEDYNDRITVIRGVTHSKGWEKRWLSMSAMPVE